MAEPVDDDDWLVDDDDEDTGKNPDSPADHRLNCPWKILITDDEVDVHSVTRLALRTMQFHGRNLELLSAYSAAEAFETLKNNPDIAVLLLDVVMETDDAGLKLVHRIRQELGNSLVRIVLRTGQPGQAPEQEVIINYDINDYKAKTELTTQKLFTTVISSLRAFESLYALENHRIGMHKIIRASADLYKIQSLREFSSGLLRQINALLNIGLEGSLCVLHQSNYAPPKDFKIIAATGSFETLADTDFLPVDHTDLPLIHRALHDKTHIYENMGDALYISVRDLKEFVIYLTPVLPLNHVERSLLEVFCDRISLAFDNLWLNDQLKESQMSAVTLLSGLADNPKDPHFRPLMILRSKIEGFAHQLHDQGHYPDSIDYRFAQQIGMAYLLHDLGKLSMNMKLFEQTTPLTDEERSAMQQHTEVGLTLLEKAATTGDNTDFLHLAAEIAYGHHERFDGTGYPQGLKGEEIPLSARISALFDVYEALIHQKSYKKAWLPEEAKDYIRSQSGKQFDPVLAELFLQYMG